MPKYHWGSPHPIIDGQGRIVEKKSLKKRKYFQTNEGLPPDQDGLHYCDCLHSVQLTQACCGYFWNDQVHFYSNQGWDKVSSKKMLWTTFEYGSHTNKLLNYMPLKLDKKVAHSHETWFYFGYFVWFLNKTKNILWKMPFSLLWLGLRPKNLDHCNVCYIEPLL